MKRYIKPETASVTLRNEDICGTDIMVASIPYYVEQDNIVEDVDEVLTKDTGWDTGWE